MFCTQCGLKLENADNFCSKCGAPARPDAPPRAQAGGRRLVRRMREKKVAGVCAGWAYYFDMDVTLMRILWLLAAIFTGLGFIAYIVAWIAMPKDYGVAAAPAY